MRRTDESRPITPFNKEHEYKQKIEPLITELVKLCTIYNIPMYVTCCTSNTDKKTEYKNSCVGAEVHNLNLTDDNIQKHICIQLGFDTIFRSETEFDFEDDATRIEQEGD